MRVPAGALLAMVLVAFEGRAAGGSAALPSPEPAHLVYLLEYVGSDYRGAVRDGKISSEMEYGEVVRLTGELIRALGASVTPADPTLAGLRQLEEMIRRCAPADEVFAKTRLLLPGLSSALGVAARPTAPPDLTRGASLWRRDCAPCHGAAAAGDGWAAPGMNPKPTPLRDQLDPLTPRQVHGALTFGIDGTAMPSFREAYSEQEFWDTAFFVMTLRSGFAPVKPPVASELALGELATSTNGELLAQLRRVRPDASSQEVDYLRASPPAPRAASDADGASPDLSVAVRLQDTFAEIAERKMPLVVGVSGYVNDATWSPEKLRVDKGEGWMAANAESLHYPGFRPVHSGSGFIADADGYVLSSNHLVRDEHGEVVPFAEVELQDGLHVPANVVGTEPTLDLAVLRIFEPKRVAEAAARLAFGDGDRLRAGHWLIAAGDPPGSEKIFSVGVVASPPSRQCYQQQLSATLLQSSLVVPDGGLGGPVFDIHGNVVGVTVEPRGARGILPIGLASNLLAALKVAQSNRSPWIGVSVLELSLLRRRLGANAASIVFPRTGVYIDDVFNPSPAAQAGIRPGDFLVELGEHPLFAVPDFQKWLYVLGAGAHIELKIQRDGKLQRVPVTIEARPDSATTR